MFGFLDLSSTVREMAQLLDSSISGQAVLEFDLDPELQLIEADEAQVSQVVMNLLTNAAEAVGEGGGSVAVSTGMTEVDAESGIETVLGEALPEGTCSAVWVMNSAVVNRPTVARLTP